MIGLSAGFATAFARQARRGEIRNRSARDLLAIKGRGGCCAGLIRFSRIGRWPTVRCSTCALARSSAAQKAVLVDRDGVLVVNKSSYAWSIDDVMFLDAGVEAIKVLAACRFGIVIVTSQSAVGPRRMTDRIVFVGENETPRGTTGGLEG